MEGGKLNEMILKAFWLEVSEGGHIMRYPKRGIPPAASKNSRI